MRFDLARHAKPTLRCRSEVPDLTLRGVPEGLGSTSHPYFRSQHRQNQQPKEPHSCPGRAPQHRPRYPGALAPGVIVRQVHASQNRQPTVQVSSPAALPPLQEGPPSGECPATRTAPPPRPLRHRGGSTPPPSHPRRQLAPPAGARRTRRPTAGGPSRGAEETPESSVML